MAMAVVLCRYCKLDPQVDAVLKQHNVHIFTAIPAPTTPEPADTCTMFMRTELGSDVWLAGVGGNEGVYPTGNMPAELHAFAEKVSRKRRQQRISLVRVCGSAHRAHILR
jgi:hypothetical protein